MARQRRFVVPALFGASILLLSPAASAGAPQASTPSPNGRYQIIINPNVRADTFLLDTQTGRVWRDVTMSTLQGSPPAWEEMYVLKTPGDYGQMLKDFGPASAASTPAPSPPPAQTPVYVTPP